MSVRDGLIAILRRVIEGGEVEYSELLAIAAAPMTLPAVEREAWFGLSYWADDADIRSKDPAYAPMRLEQLASHLQQLLTQGTQRGSSN